MFTQRKTDSYDLIGTNARNSDASMKSNLNPKYYGETLIGRMSLEQFDEGLSQHLEQVFRIPLLSKKNSSTKSEDLVEHFTR